jgi:hypothetical protein
MTEVALLCRGSPLPPGRMCRYRERRVMVAEISSTIGLHQWRKRFADRHIDGRKGGAFCLGGQQCR